MNVDKKYIIAIVVCVCLGIAFGWLLFGGESVHDNGDRIGTAREQSERIGEYQQSATESINTVRGGLDNSIDTVIRIEERTDSIEESVDTVEERNAECIELIVESTDRIRESKSILEAVRARAEHN